MAEQQNYQAGGGFEDNGFEKVQHADLPPPQITSESHYGGVEDLYGGGPAVPPPVHISSGASPSAPPAPASSPSVASVPPYVCPAKPAESSEAKSRSCCAWIKNIDPRVLDLIYWRDVKKSGAVSLSALILLLSLALFSVLSVLAYLSLILLTITVTFRLYKNVLAAVQKSGEGHPFKPYLDMDIALPEDKIHRAAEQFVSSATHAVAELRRLFLVEDMVDSLKFGLLLWVLTYIGAWFNGMTLVILALVAVFTLPKVYDTYKAQIDQHVALVRNKVEALWKQVQEKLPLPGKKKQA